MENKEKELILISKPIWTSKDILDFDDSITTIQRATQIKRKAIINFDGGVPYGIKYVKSEAVLKYYGIDREKYINELTAIVSAIRK